MVSFVEVFVMVSHQSKIRVVQRLFVLMMAFGLALSSAGFAFAQGTKPASPLASTLDSGFAVEWMQLIYDYVKKETVDAPGASRVYAYTGITVYESVVSGIPNDVSLSTQIKGMPALPALEPDAIYDWPSVTNAALQTVSDSLLSSDAMHKASAVLRAKQAAAREGVVGKDVVSRSLDRGDLIGKAIATWAASDGATEARAKAKSYTLPNDNQWDYVLTTPGTAAVGPYWGTVRPFALEKATVCDIPLNIELSDSP